MVEQIEDNLFFMLDEETDSEYVHRKKKELYYHFLLISSLVKIKHFFISFIR